MRAFKCIVTRRAREVTALQRRFATGLTRLSDAATSIHDLKSESKALRPKRRRMAAELAELEEISVAALELRDRARYTELQLGEAKTDNKAMRRKAFPWEPLLSPAFVYAPPVPVPPCVSRADTATQCT